MTPRGTRLHALVVTLAATALTLVACGSTSATGGGSAAPSAPPSIEGTSWTLTSYADASGATAQAVAGSNAGLRFEAMSKMSGSTGCNSFGGVWTQDGTSLTLTPGPTTQKACPGPLAAQETDVLAALQRVATYAIAGTDLALSGSDGKALLTYAAASTSLAGTSWTATAVNNGKGGVVSVPDGVEVTATFDGTTVAGSDGCNSYGGSWSTSPPDGIAIGLTAGTMKMCAPEVMAVADSYVAALGAAATYSIVGDELTLRDKAGATQVTFRRTA